MKRAVILSSFALVLAIVSLPGKAQSHGIRLAHPDEPLTFTYPAVSYGRTAIRVRNAHRSRLIKRSLVLRGDRRVIYKARHQKQRLPHVSRVYRTRDFIYAYPPTGYHPLPYEFGPRSAAIVVRY